MGDIGLLADRHTATCFKLAGLSNVFSVNCDMQAEKTFFEILEKNNLRILLVSEKILSKIRICAKISEQKTLIIPIPEIQTRQSPKIDFIAELIKRKIGIEVKL